MRLARSPVESKLMRARSRLRGYDVGGAVKAVRNFFTGIKGSNLDEVLEDLKGNIPQRFMIDDPQVRAAEDFKRQAQERWIDRNLRNYLIRQHGTDNDPLRQVMGDDYQPALAQHKAADLHAQLTSVINPNNMKPYPGSNTAWLHKLAVQDYPRFAADRAHSEELGNIGYMPDKDALRQKLEEIDAKHPERNNPPVNLLDIDKQKWDTGLGPELRNTLDYLRTLDPRSLPQVSVPDAIRKSQEWHAAMAKKAADADRSLIDALPVTKQYPNGAKWVVAKPTEWDADHIEDAEPGDEAYADKQKLEAMQSIGKSLGHCYQNPETCAHYLDQGELHTLIDPSGKPRVTVEVAPASAGQRGVYQADAQGNPVNEISQIRGPQNGEAPDDALPYLKDFLSSQPFGHIPYAKQYGLDKFTTQGGFPRWLDPNQFTPDMARYRVPDGGTTKLVNADEYVRRMAANRFPGLADKNGQMARATQAQAEAMVRKQMPDPANYAIPDDYQQQFFQEGDKAGGRVGYADGGLVDQVGRLWNELRGTVQGGNDTERMLANYGSRAKAANQAKLPDMKDRVARDLAAMGVARSPEHGAQMVEDMLLNDDPLHMTAVGAGTSLEAAHTAADTSDSASRGAQAYGGTINEAEASFGLPPGMLYRLIKRESNFNPGAVSKAGAIGIAQFMPATAAAMGIDPTDPKEAIPAAGEYLRSLYEKTGNWRDALASYNWGVNNVLTYGYDHAPAETRKYVSSILGKDSAGIAIERAKQSLAAQQAISNRGVLPAALGDQAQPVSRGTELSSAKRLTASDLSSRMLGELDPNDELGLLLALNSGDDEQDDGLLGLIALLEGEKGAQGEAAQ